MKFDHFSQCKELPPDVRKTFEALKADAKSEKQTKNGSSKNSSSSKGNSASSTSKYYRASASRMGLVDTPGGIVYVNPSKAPAAPSRTIDPNMVSTTATPPIAPSSHPPLSPSAARSILQQQQDEYRRLFIQQQSLTAVNTAAMASMLFPPVQISRLLAANGTNKENLHNMDLGQLTTAMNAGILQSLLMSAVAAGANAQKSIDAALALAKQQEQVNAGNHPPQEQNPLKRPRESSPPPSPPRATAATSPKHRSSSPSPHTEKTTLPLDAPEDARALNPLHCFIRKHVELFSADEDDVKAPCPGRKTRLTLGQVGIRCKHCANVPPRERVKRAVCYPPSIDGIYHSVSNMKFDHFGICPCLPADSKKELEALRSGGRRPSSKSGSRGKSTSTNTAHYYRDAAIAKGLVDTDKGIRFGQQQRLSVPAVKATTTTPVTASQLKTTAAKVLCPPPATVSVLPSPPVVAARTEIPQPIPTGMSALMMAAASHATGV